MNKLFNGNAQVELDSVWNNIKKKQETESNSETETESNQESEADKESNDVE